MNKKTARPFPLPSYPTSAVFPYLSGPTSTALPSPWATPEAPDANDGPSGGQYLTRFTKNFKPIT